MNFAPYPLVRHFLFFATGIVGYFHYGYFYNWLYALLVLAGVGLLFFSLIIKERIGRGVTAFALFFIAGWLLAYHSTPGNSSDHYIHHKDFTHYQAVITSDAEQKPKTYKVEARITSFRRDGVWQPISGKVLLYFPLTMPDQPALGDIFLLKSMPRVVEAPKNPFEFDYQTYLARQGIYAHHFLRDNEFEKIGTSPPAFINKIASVSRAYGDGIFKKFLKDPDNYSIAEAMVLGIRDEIDHNLRGAYAAAGAVHILAVSGMHVGIVFLLLRIVFGQFKKSKQKRSNSWFSLVVIVCLFAYAILTGLSPSVLRATVMFSFIQLAPLFNREQNIYNTLALSAICLLCWNPFWLFDVGFQLSYLAVFGIVLVYPHLKQLLTPTNPLIHELWNITVVSFSAQLFTFPLSVYYFHQFPNYFLLANPLVSVGAFLVMPLGILLLIFGWIPYINIVLGEMLRFCVAQLNAVIFFITDLPNALSTGFSISQKEVVLLYICIALFFLFFIRKRLYLLLMSVLLTAGMCISSIYQDYRQSKNHELTLHFIPKTSGITVIDGKEAIFISEQSITENPRLYDFHLKNYYDDRGINAYTTFQPESLQAVIELEFKSQRITWIREQPQKLISNPAATVLISNNSVKDLGKIFLQKLPEHIIIDDSNKKYIVEKLLQQAEILNIDAISLYQHGSYAVVK